MSNRKKLLRLIVLILVLILGVLMTTGCQEQTNAQELPLPVTEPAETILQEEDPFPEAEDYLWDIKNETAVLIGLADTEKKDILIPATVKLSITEDGAVHDGQNGTVYPVAVSATAFGGTDIETVIFSQGAAVEGNTMYAFFGGKGMFQNCTALKAVSNIPDEVTSMQNAFFGCTSLETAPELPSALTDMRGCFKNCTALKETPVIPDGVKDISNGFFGCTGITTTGLLPDSIENMESAFDGCSGLTELKNIPESANNMKQAFRGCVNLASIPALPDQYVAYNRCFSGCTALTGTVKIPGAVITPLWETPGILDMFQGCEGLERIILNCCENADAVAYVPEEIPVTITIEHTEKGECPGCHYVTDDYVVEGLNVHMDNVPGVYVEKYLELLEYAVPDELLKTCRKITFTQDLGKYNKKYEDSIWKGFATNPEGRAYVRAGGMPYQFWPNATPERRRDLMNSDTLFLGTIVHELAHCYDYNFTSTPRHSDSASFKVLCKEEGSVFIPELKARYKPAKYRVEMFARSVERYYLVEEQFQEECPGMYAYIDGLFGKDA